ncbi:sodium-dependent transporter [Streptomyces sp. MUM 178J]|uniref:sodium-dependent transporter n=1 Tax=Streptomyces sp. MUM 178J TaxID=2791991 RepID=UPI001F03E2A5|nr:sodium-dependent transporter [Streptomyces sp. MUM 178J]WRQ81749.1 sodium-dependent transporter [Streptomyces sp. MUM 178J]
MAAKEVFASRFTFVVAGIGMAVGTGNIWRFPRVAAEWGGGAFLIALVVANLVWAIPILMAESYMGSRSRLGTVGAFRDFMGRRFAWLGGFMAATSLAITFYYSVVCGWTLRYLIYALTGTFTAERDTQALWDDFTATPWQTVLSHLVAIAIVGAVVVRGLKRGFEKVLKYAIPLLFAILVVLAVQALTLDGATEGLRHLFTPEWSRLGDAQLWLQAFSQMAFSTGAGWGLYLTYSVYLRSREDFGLNATVVCGGNLLASLLAGTAVIVTLFALGTQEQIDSATAGNEGLAFIFFPQLLNEMPGGAFFGVLFFLALALAGISSLIAMVELATRNVMDAGVSRPRAVGLVVTVTAVAGLPSAFSLDFLSNQDFVWGVALLIGGLLAAFAMMKYGLERARADLDAVSDLPVWAWWPWLIRLFPLMFAVLIGWWIHRAITEFAPDDWWNPLVGFSAATMVLQWLVVLLVLRALNRFLADRIGSGPMTRLD